MTVAHDGPYQPAKAALNGKRQADIVLIPTHADAGVPSTKVPGTVLSAILPEDDKTGDAWVPRDPKMIRLTGRHPFNSECPPTDLMASYITSPELHYVRNHGAVPKVSRGRRSLLRLELCSSSPLSPHLRSPGSLTAW